MKHDAPHQSAELEDLSRRVGKGRLSRRDALWFFTASVALPPALQGCATSPVTGQTILAGMSEREEIAVDRQQAPRQFSSDLGAIQDANVNRYVSDVSGRLQAVVHRPQMPYSVRVVNANYVNAYTFPGGAMAITRGIMVELQDEAELAALLGHELAHVNARHAAQRQGQALVASVALATLAVAASDSKWSPLLEIGATVGASALLARYSRDNEHEADALGQGYMVKAGYPAEGMVRLHELLVRESGREPGLLEAMFSSHPMSGQRRDLAREAAQLQYGSSRNAPAGRERYMDRTAPLRAIKPTIVACQKGELLLSRKKPDQAEERFGQALRHSPQDYPSLLRMSQSLQAQGKRRDAMAYARQAREAYPSEAQAMKHIASLHMAANAHEAALQELNAFDRALPGDPGIGFLRGVNQEALGQRDAAARSFRAFLKQVPNGQASQYAQGRLKAWGQPLN
jgi:predicted Zn-dependent protease